MIIIYQWKQLRQPSLFSICDCALLFSTIHPRYLGINGHCTNVLLLFCFVDNKLLWDVHKEKLLKPRMCYCWSLKITTNDMPKWQFYNPIFNVHDKTLV